MFEKNFNINSRLSSLIDLFDVKLADVVNQLRESTELVRSELEVLEKIEAYENRMSELKTKVVTLRDTNSLALFTIEHENFMNSLKSKDMRLEKDSLEIVNALLRVIKVETDKIADPIIVSLNETEVERKGFKSSVEAVRARIESLNQSIQQSHWNPTYFRRMGAFGELDRLADEMVLYFGGDSIEDALTEIAIYLDELDDVQRSLPEKISAII